MAFNLRGCASDPVKFRAALHVPTSSGLQPFGAILADHQRKDFAAIDPAIIALAKGETHDPRRFWIERTKGGSKDTDVSIAALWLLAFSPRPLRMQAAARDAEQADEVRLIVRQILAADAPLNRALAKQIEVQRTSIVNRTTGSEWAILTADKHGSHGARPDLLLCNELSHVGDEEFPATLLDNADKCPHAVVIIATNAGYLDTWQWRWRQLAQESARWYFSVLDCPSPWVSEADLTESERRNTQSRFRRLWWGVWAAGNGDALDADDITAAINLDLGPMEGAVPGFAFVAGLDVGIKHDHAALVIVGRHGRTSRLRVAKIESWRPGRQGVDLEQVETACREAHRRFRLARLYYDPYQAALMAQRLQRHGVPVTEVPFVGKNLDLMASTLMDVFRSRRIDLYPDERLTADLRRLTIAEKSYGYKLEATRTAAGHADVATALAIALPHAVNLPAHSGVGWGGVVGESSATVRELWANTLWTNDGLRFPSF